MKTEAIDYNKLYAEARKLFFEDSKSYTLDRKAENLAYMLALESGLRVSDLLLLKYDDFKYNDVLKKYVFTTKIKKTKSIHTGVISNELYNYIQNYIRVVKREYNALNECLFYNYRTNKPYTRQWLHKRIKLVSEKLGFENCGVHSIRKASAIKVLDSTGSLSLAQYHLTHKRATTTDKYLGITKSSALEQLSKVF